MIVLTIFYDGHCPLCQTEMRRLHRLNRQQKLAFVDLHMAEFSRRYPEINLAAANTLLHGQLSDGSWLYGLDVTAKAWQLVCKGRWLRPLRSGFLRAVSDRAYLFFARHRYTVSGLLTGKRRCQSCQLEFDKD